MVIIRRESPAGVNNPITACPFQHSSSTVPSSGNLIIISGDTRTRERKACRTAGSARQPPLLFHAVPLRLPGTSHEKEGLYRREEQVGQDPEAK